MDPYVLLADRDIPDLHIRAGDHVVVHPGALIPCTKCESIAPNFGRLLREAETGALRLIDDGRQLDDFASAVGLELSTSAPSKRRGRRGSHPPYLVRLK